MCKMFVSVIAAVAVFAAFSAAASDLKPVKYQCYDGRIFTITFVKAKGEDIPSKANLVFSSSKNVEILENQLMGSGIAYANEKYKYSEHHGDVSLTDFTRGKKGGKDYETSCHEIE